MRSSFPHLSRRHLALALAAIVVLAVVAIALLLAFGHSARHIFTSGSGPAQHSGGGQTVIADRGLDPKSGSWTRPWHAGNPQAKTFGEAFQVLDPQHPPAHAHAVYWLGGIQGNLYPYVRAMQGGHKEVIQSAVSYGDKRSADLAHLMIMTWDTRPFPVIDQQTQGGKLLAQFNRIPHHTAANGLTWADAGNPTAGWQALVVVGPHTIVQVIRMDDSVPSLPALVAKLQPYQGAPAVSKPAAPRPTVDTHSKATRRAKHRRAKAHRAR